MNDITNTRYSVERAWWNQSHYSTGMVNGAFLYQTVMPIKCYITFSGPVYKTVLKSQLITSIHGICMYGNTECTQVCSLWCTAQPGTWLNHVYFYHVVSTCGISQRNLDYILWYTAAPHVLPTYSYVNNHIHISRPVYYVMADYSHASMMEISNEEITIIAK